MRRFLDRALRLTGSLALLGLLAAAAVYAADPVYWKRWLTFPARDGYQAVEWYAPLESVAGREREVPVAAPEARSIDGAALDAAEQYAAATGSVALIVYHRGAIQLERYFPGFSRQTRTESFGLQRGVVVALLGIAIAEGSIGSVDDPVGRYLEEWRDDPRGRITLADLLQARSGLDEPAFSFNPLRPWMRRHLSTDLAAATLATELTAEPGTKPGRGEIEAQLLALVIERAAGMRYAEFLSSRLWSRLGAPPADVWLDRPGGTAHAYGGLQTTARGWLQFGRLILGRGELDGERILPEAWVNEQFLDRKTLTLEGWGGQRVYVVPSRDLVIVRTGRPRQDWDDAALVHAVLAGIEPGDAT